VCYWSESYEENKKFGTLNVGNIRTFDFTYHGVPYTRYSDRFNNDDNGVKMTVIKHSPSEGKLSLVYSGPSGTYGWAMVDVYIQMRNKPDNAIQIQKLKNEIVDLQKEIADAQKLIEKNRDSIEKFNLALLDILQKGLESNEKLKEARLQTLALEREKLETDLNQDRDKLKIKSKKKLKVAIKHMSQKQMRDRCQLIIKVNGVMEFDKESELVRDFIIVYQEWLQTFS